MEVKELLQSHVHVHRTTLSYITSMALRCALDLGIFDAVHKHGGHPVTVTELTDELALPQARTTCFARLMRMLQHAGYFAKQTNDTGEEGYVLTSPSLFLLNRGTPWAQSNLHPAMILSWLHWSEWLRSDAPTAFHLTNGMGVWEYAGRTPEFNKLFNDGMAHDADLVACQLVAECRPVFSGIRSLVDVGGGNGTVARAITDAFPHLKCIVFDLPHVVAAQTPSENVHYVGGDMFDAIPHAEVVLLKRILHDYDDEKCIKILRQSRKAIPPREEGGKVIVIDMVLNVVRDNSLGLIEDQIFSDMKMMIYLNGKEREEHEWEKLFRQAGFTSYNIIHTLNFQCLIEVFP